LQHLNWWRLSGLKLLATFKEGPIEDNFGPQGEQGKQFIFFQQS
jgi:hypothetical protein